MNSKRMVLAVAVVFATLVVAGVLIHVMWLGRAPHWHRAFQRDGGFSHSPVGGFLVIRGS